VCVPYGPLSSADMYATIFILFLVLLSFSASGVQIETNGRDRRGASPSRSRVRMGTGDVPIPLSLDSDSTLGRIPRPRNTTDRRTRPLPRSPQRRQRRAAAEMHVTAALVIILASSRLGGLAVATGSANCCRNCTAAVFASTTCYCYCRYCYSSCHGSVT